MTDLRPRTQLRIPRYVVTEIEGDLTPRGSGNTSAPRGLSCHVIDTRANRQLVATFRTEDLTPTEGGYGYRSRRNRRALVRERAAARCDLLNRLDELATLRREAVSPHSETAA